MKRFKDILCVVTAGKESSPTLERAVSLAEKNEASLTVVDIIEGLTAGMALPKGGPGLGDLQAAMRRDREEALEKLVVPYRKRIEIGTAVLKGTPFLEVIRDVLRNGRDLVIKSPERQDWLDRFFGSDDMHLLRKCPCPVWLTKPQPATSYRRIVAAVDLDDAYPPEELESRRALNLSILEMASSLALSDGAELHIVHAWEAIGENAMRGAFMRLPEEQVTNYVEQVRRQHSTSMSGLMRDVTLHVGKEPMERLSPHMHLVKGRARKEIQLLARRIEADLVVMGTVARTGIPGFIMGNTAETILNHIDCSVLAIKPPGFVTPVELEG